MLKDANDGDSRMSVLKGLSETDILFEMKEETIVFSTPQSRKLKVDVDEPWYKQLRSLL